MRTRLLAGLSAAALAGTAAVVGPILLRAPLAAASAATPYTFHSVAVGGGGFVPGIEYSSALKGLVYARTDIGGLYRMDPGSSTWKPLTDWAGWGNWGYLGGVSVAPDPTDANKVWAAVGMYTNSWDPNPGAILRSTDRGDTWKVSPLPFKLGGNMPGRGMGERLVVDPNDDNVLYLAAPSGQGLWRSTDGGVSWAQVTAFPNPGTYVAKAGDSYSGDNQGDVWVAFDSSTGTAGSATKTIYVGVADPTNPVYQSTDGGATWAPVAGAPIGFIPHKGVVDAGSHTLYIATSDTGGPYDGSHGDVWKYAAGTGTGSGTGTAAGAGTATGAATGTWTRISPVPSTDTANNTFGYSGLTIDRQHPGTLMVATQISYWPDMSMWRSTDSGATWTRIWDWASYPDRTLRYKLDITAEPWLTFGAAPTPPTPSPKLGWMNESVEIDPFNSDHMMYGTGATIYGTDNLTAWDTGGTVNLTPRVDGLEETSVEDLISPPSGAPLISALGDIEGFRHDDVTKVPAMMFTGPTFGSTTSLDYAELKPSIIARAGDFNPSNQPNDKHAAFSTDGATTWFQGTEPSGVSKGGTIAAAADGSRFVWAPGDSGQQVVNSVGFGNTWTASTGVPANALVASDRVNPMKFYAFSAGTFYASTDGGASFTATAATGLPTGSVHVKAVAGHEGDIWLTGGTTGLWHSTDGGATFAKVAGVDQADNIGFGKAAPGATYPALYTVAQVGGVRGIFRSDDAGVTWLRINDDAHQWGNPSGAITGDPRVYGRVYIGTNGRGIIYGDPLGAGGGTPAPASSSAAPASPAPASSSAAPASPAPASSSAAPSASAS